MLNYTILLLTWMTAFFILLSVIFKLFQKMLRTLIFLAACSYLDRKHLTDLFDALKYNWVTINQFCNQTFNGLLSNISDDHIMLINDTEILIIHKSFISNIYKGTYEPKEQHDTSTVNKKLL